MLPQPQLSQHQLEIDNIEAINEVSRNSYHMSDRYMPLATNDIINNNANGTDYQPRPRIILGLNRVENRLMNSHRLQLMKITN